MYHVRFDIINHQFLSGVIPEVEFVVLLDVTKVQITI